MNKYSLSTVIICMFLSACGVREEETEGGTTTDTTSSSTSSSISSSSTSTDSSSEGTTGTSTSIYTQSAAPDELANDEQVEGRGIVVKLKFTDEYTGFWENETRSPTLPKQIRRITFGQDKYHIESFFDQNSGTGALLQNCYVRSGHTQRSKSEKGLWFVLETTNGSGEEIHTEDGWTLVGGKLEYTYFNSGVQRTHLSVTSNEVFEGLPVDGLQICE